MVRQLRIHPCGSPVSRYLSSLPPRISFSMHALACLCHSRDVPIRRDPRSNPERRSAESVFALQIQRGRQSGLNSPLVCSAKHPVGSERQTCDAAGADRSMLDALAASWRASASRVLLHGTGTPTAGGIGIPTAVVLTRVNNHFPSIFIASPVRSTWLLAVQNGWPVAGFVDTSK